MSIHQLPVSIKGEIEENLNEGVKDFQFISGGCINHGGRLITNHNTFFIKWNSKEKYPGMFEAEARGLKLLEQADAVRVPKAIHTGNVTDLSFILMEYLEGTTRSSTYWEDFGNQLARQHKISSKQFGLDHGNYIGSLSQLNPFTENWKIFFIQYRLSYQLKLAVDSGKVSLAEGADFEKAFKNLEESIPDESPALLHGDMWGGNLITGPNGEPCLIDPAVYFGHREMDIAMTQLFGGFDARYLDVYQEEFPMKQGWKQRLDSWNLYPLLVHVNLFGGGYINQVRQILTRYQ